MQDVISISSSGIHEQIKFIQNVSKIKMESRVKVQPNCKKNVADIFHRKHEDNRKEHRDWIFVEDSVLYCIHCLLFCMPSLRIDELSTTGIDFNALNNRLAQKISRHETKIGHTQATTQYLSISAPAVENVETESVPSAIDHIQIARNAVKCITKIIIHIVTHGRIS